MSSGEKLKKALRSAVHSLDAKEVLWANEVSANHLVEKILYISALILLLTPILNEVGIYKIQHHTQLWILTGVGLCILLIPAAICHYYKGERWWINVMMLVSLVLAYGMTDAFLTYRTVMLMAIPTVLSARYFNRRLTLFIQVLTTLVFGFSCSFGVLIGMLDLNYVEIPTGTVLEIHSTLLQAVSNLNIDLTAQEWNMMLRAFLPKYLLYILIAIASSAITIRGFDTVMEQSRVSTEHSRVETELNMARRIQEKALPIVHSLPNHPSYDLAASMDPAKEVGGDFYDFFYIDPTHLALMIADVSGKGVPASLFMMVSKILLDNSLQGGRTPGQALAEVNHQLCEKNMDDMFVTVWVGILDLETGEMVTANGGHEYPFIRRKGGGFEVFKDKHGLVLGGMDGMPYPETRIQLFPGDTIFVYTDGVPESINSRNEQFGIDRALQALNRAESSTVDDLLQMLTEDIGRFAGEAPQFDDTTMLALRLNDLVHPDGWSGVPDRESIPLVAAYVEETLEQAELPMKSIHKLNIAVDEIYSNIVNYSQAAHAWARCEITPETAAVILEDDGFPFDPLQAAEPDVGAALEDRPIGGLGIFMTKKLMDGVEYRYIGGRNQVRLTLNR